jgi:sugar (pentulose or hexulose) kinase
MPRYVIGLDFGTNSCRSLLVDTDSGRELASHVFRYPSGTGGVILNPLDPGMARQNPADYILGIEETVRGAIGKAKAVDPEFSPEAVIGIGIDTTGSSPMPVDEQGQALWARPFLQPLPPVRARAAIDPWMRLRNRWWASASNTNRSRGITRFTNNCMFCTGSFTMHLECNSGRDN